MKDIPNFDNARLILKQYTESEKIAGLYAGVANGRSLVFSESYGKADISRDTPFNENTIVRIYSMTKPIVSLAMLKLFEECRLRLDDPLSLFVPEFKEMKVFSKENPPNTVPMRGEISLRHLLTHTSGLGYWMDFENEAEKEYAKKIWGLIEKWDEMSTGEWLAPLADVPLLSQPGEAWNYSLSVDLLGLVIEKVSGSTLAEYLQKTLFCPLGMNDTSFSLRSGDEGRLAAMYGPGNDGVIQVIEDSETEIFKKKLTVYSGGGGLLSTGHDYLRFARALLGRGEFEGSRILGKKTVDFMCSNHLLRDMNVWENPSLGFGLGVSVRLANAGMADLGSKGEYGWGGMANTFFWVDPVEDLTGVIMLQYMPSDTHPVTTDFKNCIYSAL